MNWRRHWWKWAILAVMLYGGCGVGLNMIFGLPGIMDLEVENRTDQWLTNGVYRRGDRDWRPLPAAVASVAPNYVGRAVLEGVSSSDVDVKYTFTGFGTRFVEAGHPDDGWNVEVRIVADDSSLTVARSVHYRVEGKKRVYASEEAQRP